MAKIKDIQDNPLFAPEHKDSSRKAKSLSAFLALPTILGLVSSQNQWIKRGTTIGFKEAFTESLSNLFREARKNPILNSMSGGPAIQRAIEVHEEAALSQLAKKGSGKNIGSDIPNLISHAERVSKLTFPDIRRHSYFANRITQSYENALSVYQKNLGALLQAPIDPSDFVPDNLVPLLGQLPSDIIDPYNNIKVLKSMQQDWVINAEDTWKKASAAQKTTYSQEWLGNLHEQMRSKGLAPKGGWASAPHDPNEKVWWIDPTYDQRLNELTGDSAKADVELKRFSRERNIIWNKWTVHDATQDILRTEGNILQHQPGVTWGTGFTYKQQIAALWEAKVKLEQARSWGRHELTPTIDALTDDIGKMFDARMGVDSREEVLFGKDKKAIIDEIKGRRQAAFAEAARLTKLSDIVRQTKEESSLAWKELTHIDRWNRFRQAIELVDSAIYHHSLVNSDRPLSPLKAFGSDKEILDFIKNEADPKYLNAVRDVYTEISADYSNAGSNLPSGTVIGGKGKIIGDRLLLGKIEQIVRDALDQPLLIRSQLQWNAKDLYENVTGKKLGDPGKAIITADMAKGERELAGIIKNSISNYEIGLSMADRKRIGDIKTFSARLKGRERLYKSVFESTGQGALYKAAYGTTKYSDRLAKMLSAFDSKIKEIKVSHARLVSRAANGNETAKRQLVILAKAVDEKMSVTGYSEMIKGLDVSMELKTDLHGNLAHQRAILKIKIPGKTTLKHSIPLERFGQFSTSSFSRLYNSALLLSSGVTPSIHNVSTIGIAQIDEMSIRSEKIINDLIESGWKAKVAERSIRSMTDQYTNLAGTATGHVQDRIRGMKVVSEEFAVLAGQKSSYYYSTHALGRKSILADRSITKTESTLVAFDLEFSSPYTTLAGSSRMVKDPRTRMFWMNYVLKKGSGAKENIINHYIVPDNWADIRDNVKKFMTQKQQPGDSPGADGFTKWFDWLDNRFKEAQKEFSDKGVDMVTLRSRNPRTGKVENVLFYNEKRSMLTFAKDLYGADSLDKQVTWLGHNIGTADLSIVNRSAKRILKASQDGIDKLQDSEKRLIERLVLDTTPETLLARGNVIDTYAWGRMLQVGSHEKTALSLTSLFDSLMEEASQKVVSRKLDKRTWSKQLSDAVKGSGGKITRSIKHMIDDLPSNVRGSIKRWIQEDWRNVVYTFGEGGHHDPGFDTRTDIILRDLLHWKTENIRNYNPALYAKMMKIGTLSEEIVEGRRFAWSQPLEIVQQSELYELDPTGRAPDGTLLRSHLFAFSPDQARAGRGALFGPENYLPFGHKMNLQKQAYQVLTQKALLTAPGIEVSAARNSASKSLFPVLEHSLSDLAQTDTGFSMWMTATRAAITKEFLMEQMLGGRLGVTPKSRLQMMAYYLPSNNSLTGEDTAIMSPKFKDAFRHLPAGGAGQTLEIYAPFAKGLLQTAEDELVGVTSKKLTLAGWLRKNGVNSAIIESVEATHPGLTLKEFVEASKGSGILQLDLIGPRTITDFEPGAQNILGPNTNLMEVNGVASPVWDASRRLKENKYMTGTGAKYHVKNPIKQAAVLKSIAFDYHNETFLFDITPIETPGFTKLVDPLKLFKGNSIGFGSGFLLGEGIGTVLGAKKPNVAQMLEVHMRRALNIIYKNNPADPNKQKQLIKNLIIKSFEITDSEFDSMFDLKSAPISKLQSKDFGTSVIVPVVKSTSDITYSNNQLFKGAVKMLQLSGVTHAEVKQMFIDLRLEEIHGYAKKVGSRLTRGDIEKQLKQVYDSMRNKQKEAIIRISQSASMEVTDQAAMINEMRRVVQKTETALWDPFLTVEFSKLDVEKFKEHGLFESGNVNSLLKGVYTESMAHLLPSEFSLMETIADVKGPQKLATDIYGTPIKKTWSMWQVMLMYNATEGNNVLRTNLFKQVLPKMGKFQDIDNALQTYYAASLTMKKGFTFDTTKTSYSGRKKVFTLKDILKTTELMKVAKELNINEDWATIQQVMAKSDSLKTEIELMLKENRPDARLGLVTKADLDKIKLFKTEADTLFKFELPDIENIFNEAKVDEGVLKVVRDVQNKQKAMMIREMRDTLVERSASASEKQQIELMIKQWGLMDNVAERLEGIIVPYIKADGPQPIPGGKDEFVLGTQMNRIMQVTDAISAYSEETHRLAAQIKDGSIGETGLVKLMEDYQKNSMAKIGAPLTALVYEGINNHAWKANQFYAGGVQYGKAVNNIVLASNIIGTIRNQGIAASEQVLTRFEGTNAILDALGSLKKQAGKGQAQVLDKLIEATKGITMDDVLHGISKPQNPKEAIGNILRSIEGQKGNFYGVKGMGLNERIMPSGQFAASLMTMHQGDDLNEILLRLTGTDVGADKAGKAILKGKVDNWIALMTGKKRVQDFLMRMPAFENVGIQTISDSYIWHDELFRQIGMKSDEINKIVTVNQMELMLMGGDFDGDLVQRMLQLSSLGDASALTKEQIINDLQSYHGLSQKKVNKRYGGMSKTDLKKLWNTAQRDSVKIQMGQLKENISWESMKNGKGALLQSGTDYSNIVNNITEVDGRYLLKDMGEEQMKVLMDSQMQGYVNTVITDEASAGMRSRALTYMIQQTLVGPVGEQQKRFDIMFSGGSNSPIRTNVIEKIKNISNSHKMDDNTVQFLAEIDAKFDKTQANDSKYVRERARKLATSLEHAWDRLNDSADLYFFEDPGPGATGKPGKMTWKQSGMTKLGYLRRYLAGYTHHVPIEKQKQATSSVLVSMEQMYRARTLFGYGFYNDRSKVGFNQAVKMLWNGLDAVDANAKNMLLDIDSDVFATHADRTRAGAELEKQKKLFLSVTDDIGFIMGTTARLEANQLIYGNLTSQLVGRGPKAGAYGFLHDAFTHDSTAWVGHAFMEGISRSDIASISEADDMAKYIISRTFDTNSVRTRAMLEQTSRTVGDMLHGVMQGRWAKRAGVAALALMILDPNTNSILLPDQRAEGERYDIPSLQELSKTYRNRLVKFRENSPVFLDKMARAVGLPTFGGSPGYENPHMPPAPPGMVNYTKIQHRRDPLSLSQMSKQVEGIMLR
jgi:hypothetical protein